MDFFKNIGAKLSNVISGTASDVTEPIANTAPAIATDSGSQQMLGTSREKKGFTMAGGRRVKTRRSRKSKKTHKSRSRK